MGAMCDPQDPARNIRPLFLSAALAIAVLLVEFSAPEAAALQARVTLSVEIGFHGRYVPERDTPVRVLVEYEGPPQEAELVLRQESLRALSKPKVVELRRSIRLSARAKQRYELYFPLTNLPAPEGRGPELAVRLVASDGRGLASQTVDLSGRDERVPLTLLVDETDYPRVLPTGERIEQLDVEALPRDRRGYSGVARVYLGRVNVGRIDPERRRALTRWVAGGGTLIVLTGENFFVQDDPWLRDLLPVEIERVDEIAAARARRGGETLLYEGEAPLLVRWRFNRGWVYFSALALSGRDEREREYWEELVPPAPTRTAEGSPDLGLGTELFQTMELYSPSRTVLTGLLGAYLLGVGLLSLWVIRRSRRYDAFGELIEVDEDAETDASGWRVLALLLGWVALTLVGSLVYLKQPAFASGAQSLEVGVLWGEAGRPWMEIETWYNVIVKRPIPLELQADEDARIISLGETGLSVRLEPERQEIRFLPEEVTPWEQEALFVEEVRPPLVRVRVRSTGVRTPQFQVYNESSWPLRDVALRVDGIYYRVGDLPPGSARDVSLGGTGNRAWPSLLSETARFEDRLKAKLYEAVEREIGAESEDPILLAWISQESLERASGEHRLTWKLLVIRIPKGG